MKRQNKGITIIALIITIVVLLILAVVTIKAVQDGGIIINAKNATEEHQIGKEKEQISLAFMQMKFETEEDLDERTIIFQGHLDKHAGQGNSIAYNSGTGYIIHFVKTNRVYNIDEKGNITEEDPAIIKEDDVAGALDGTGTEIDPFVIMSIEDLVWFGNQVNSGTNTYAGKWVALGKPLDFKSKLSYKNVETTYSYDETTNSYIPNEESETTLMELCTTVSGFIPIGTYNGNFDGNNYAISNIYVNTTSQAGLFSRVAAPQKMYSTIRNLTIDGKIISTNTYAGGIVGYMMNNGKIQNCVNKAEVQGTYVGGIAGYTRYGQELIVDNCTNSGIIKGVVTETISSSCAGGIIGYRYHGKSITNCNNTESVSAAGYAGGIVRLFLWWTVYY